MRKKVLTTKLLVIAMVSASVMLTSCGKKDSETELLAETLVEQTETLPDIGEIEGVEETYISPEEQEEIEAMKTNPFEVGTDEITEAEMASVEAELARQKEEDEKAAKEEAKKDTKSDTKAGTKKDTKSEDKAGTKTDTKADTNKTETASTGKSETKAPTKQETASDQGTTKAPASNGNTTSNTTPAPSTPAASNNTSTDTGSSGGNSQTATPTPTPEPTPAAPNPATCAHEYVYIGPGLDAPSCEYMGTSFYKCTKCGAGKDQTDVPALGHDYSIVEEIVVGDCVGPSTVRYTCSRCGLSYCQEENLHADSHDWKTASGTRLNWDTGEDEPYTETYCVRCGKSQ